MILFAVSLNHGGHLDEERNNKIFLRHLAEVSQLLALVLVVYFKLPDFCWK